MCVCACTRRYIFYSVIIILYIQVHFFIRYVGSCTPVHIHTVVVYIFFFFCNICIFLYFMSCSNLLLLDTGERPVELANLREQVVSLYKPLQQYFNNLDLHEM